MVTLLLLMGLLQLSPAGVSPCTVAKSKPNDGAAHLTIKQICSVEKRLTRLRDGMSWPTAIKTLGLSQKHLLVIARGGMTHHYLGNGYELAIPFSLNQTPKRVLLLDGEGNVVKDVRWQ